jgi:hypothetical protein
MQSVPLAMTWEFFRKGCWQLLLGGLAMLALPTLVFSAVLVSSSMTRADLRQEGFYTFHYACLLFQALTIGAAALGSQESISRFYAWPVLTSTIVTWRLLPGMGAMGLINLATTTATNLMFDVGWPLVGPALFMACTYPAFQAAIWLGEKVVVLQVILISAVATCLGAWLNARHGGWFTGAKYLWTDVTTGEVLTLMTVALLGWLGACVGVRRDRCGESLRWLWIKDWMESWSLGGRINSKPFRSPAWAQFWFEWQQKGLLMPVVVFVGISTMCLVIFIRQVLIGGTAATDFELGNVLTGMFLPIVGLLVGLAIGQSGGGRDKMVMGPFLASRPIADQDLSRPMLIVTALSTLLSWSILAAFVLVVEFLFASSGMTIPRNPTDGQAQLSIFFGTLLLTWLAAAMAACVAKTGHTRLMAQIFATLFALLVVWLFLSGPLWKLGPITMAVPHVVFGVSTILGTAGAFTMAVHRRLIALHAALISLVVWMAACIAIGSALSGASDPKQPGGGRLVAPGFVPVISIGAFGLTALAVAPLALGPLAVAWNRHR